MKLVKWLNKSTPPCGGGDQMDAVFAPLALTFALAAWSRKIEVDLNKKLLR
jgi:hypothetical protein